VSLGVTEALNLRLVVLCLRLTGSRRDAIAAAVRGSRSAEAVETRWVYLFALGNIWPVLAGAAIGIFGPALAIIHYAGLGHNELGVRVFVFTEVALLVGILDPLWRLILVGHVRKQFRRNDHVLSDSDRRLMRVSLVRFPTLAIQLASGVAAAVLMR